MIYLVHLSSKGSEVGSQDRSRNTFTWRFSRGGSISTVGNVRTSAATFVREEYAKRDAGADLFRETKLPGMSAGGDGWLDLLSPRICHQE